MNPKKTSPRHVIIKLSKIKERESFFFKDFIYLFDRERHTQLEREHKQGEWEKEKQAHSRGA